MKKAIIGCLAILLALSFVMIGCDLGGIGGPEEKSAYTFDSNGNIKSATATFKDGKLEFSAQTTRSARALSDPVAKGTYNFFEVVFVGDTNIARTQWNFGEAGIISGIQRDSTGINYLDPTATVGTGVGQAILFIGNRDNSNLLAVGTLSHIDGNPATGANVLIKDSTKTVTFSVNSLVAGIDAQSLGDPDDVCPSNKKTLGTCLISGCDGTELGCTLTRDPDLPFVDVTIQIDTVDNIGTKFKGYFIPATASSATLNYDFGFAGTLTDAAKRFESIKIRDTVIVTPRMNIKFVKGGLLYTFKGETSSIKTTVVGSCATSGNIPTNGRVPFVITPTGTDVGLNSFTYFIPVLALTATPSDDGVIPYSWIIAPGQDMIETLDNNTPSALGGSVLLVVGTLPKFGTLGQDTIRIKADGVLVTNFQ